MTLRIPKKGTGSTWSRHYWIPAEYPAIPLLLSLAPATRRWLFDVQGSGVGFYWTRGSYQSRDIDANWRVGDLSLAVHAATGCGSGRGCPPLPDNADVDRALWLPENPWAVLEALHAPHRPLIDPMFLSKNPRFSQPKGDHDGFTYRSNLGDKWGYGDTAIEAVLRLADKIIGKES